MAVPLFKQGSAVIYVKFYDPTFLPLRESWNVQVQSLVRNLTSWDQFYKMFYTVGQIYKRILKYENNVLTITDFGHFRTYTLTF